MPRIGFLQTADVHVAMFDRLVSERAPDIAAMLEVRTDLFDAAHRHGLAGPAAALVAQPARVRSSPGAAVEAALAHLR